MTETVARGVTVLSVTVAEIPSREVRIVIGSRDAAPQRMIEAQGLNTGTVEVAAQGSQKETDTQAESLLQIAIQWELEML